jgi:hypothetical protein
MSIKLDKEAIENIKKYKFGTNDFTTLEKYIFNPFWEFIVTLLPRVKLLKQVIYIEYCTKLNYNDGNDLSFNISSSSRVL